MPSPTVQYQYANGSSNSTRLTGVVYPNGRSLGYLYGSSGGADDAASRVTGITDTSGSTLAGYEYLGLGTVARVDYPEPAIENVLAGGGTNPNTGDIYTGLDQFGRIIDCRWRKYSASPATDIERVKYTYDRVGNRLTRQNPVAATTANNFWDEKYTYDSLYRLTDAKRGTLSGGSISPLKFEQNWTLDATGNWGQFKQDDNGNGTWDLEQTRAASKVNEITSIGATTGPTWATPAYDANGNMTTIPKTDDPTTTYTAKYDAWNRLVKLTDTATSQVVQENAYDGRGYRTVRKTYASGTLSETRHFYYTESWQCVEERLGTSPSSAAPDRQFVWGVRYIDDLILRDRSTTSTLDERLYTASDPHSNVTAILNQMGTVTERFWYSSYGLPKYLTAAFAQNSGSASDWTTLFSGMPLDGAVQQYLCRFRLYLPLLGTWATRDPSDDDVPLYEFNDSCPILLLDPFGLEGGSEPGIPRYILDHMACGSEAHRVIQRSVKENSGAGVEVERTIRALSREYGDGSSNSAERVDIINMTTPARVDLKMKCQGRGDLYEIKRNSPNGRISGAADLRFYMRELKDGGITALPGQLPLGGMKGARYISDCGGIVHWWFEGGGLVLYEVEKKKQKKKKEQKKVQRMVQQQKRQQQQPRTFTQRLVIGQGDDWIEKGLRWGTYTAEGVSYLADAGIIILSFGTGAVPVAEKQVAKQAAKKAIERYVVPATAAGLMGWLGLSE